MLHKDLRWTILVVLILTLLVVGCGSPGSELVDRETMESLGGSVKNSFLEEADRYKNMLASDSDNPEALEGLTDVQVLLYVFGYVPRESALPEARSAVAKLKRIKPDGSNTHKLSGILRFLDWQWNEAETDFLHAIGSDPGNLNARHWYSLYLAAMGRFDEAMAQSDTIWSMDPGGDYHIGRGSLLYFARRNDELKNLMLQVVDRDPSVAWGYDWLGMAYIELKDYENSLDAYRKGFALSEGTMEVGAGYGHALGMAGEYRAAKILADYYASAAKEHYLPPVQRAYIHIGLGDYDEAIRLLEQAYRERSWFLIFMQVEPWLDPVRDRQVFAEIKNRMGFPFSYTSEAAPEWTELMVRTSGWFAADGIFTIPLDGKEDQGVEGKQTLFIFSDTYIGEVVENVPLPGNVMVNNTTAWMTGTEPDKEEITFRYNTDENGAPTSYFIPDNEVSEEGEYFWLGDGFINHEKGNALYLFAYHVHKTGPNVFDFSQTNIALLKIRDPSPEGIKDYEQFATGLHFIHPDHGIVYFGSGVFVNTKKALAPDPDGYVYIYGIMEGKKSLIAARVKPAEIERFDKWRFWNGLEWADRKEDVAPITDGVSNELSVTPTGDGRYILTFMVMGISDKIGMQVGYSPVGPFGELYEVYTCPEYADKGLLPYNAKAHYHLSKPWELLVSYNTITFNFWEDIQKDASIYHPRFIWVKYR